MRYFLYALLAIMMMFTSVVVYAQSDEPLITEINYGMTVEETITERAFFDWWQINAAEGDMVIVSMEASDGLQPLIGLLNSNGDLVARSDSGDIAEVNGVSFLQYEAVEEGQYTIIATRDGRDQGTTTGRYLLTVTNRNDTESSRPNPYRETEFRCDEWIITNALTFEFSEDLNRPEEIVPGQITEFYRVTVLGLDGFEPVIRMLSNILPDRPLDCTDSWRATAGTQFDAPFLDSPIAVTDEDTDHVAMVTLTNTGDAEPLDTVWVTIGAKEGTSGRFIVILEGLELHDRTDTDEFFVRRGPFAGETPLDIYMIGFPDTRLDSLIETLDIETDDYQLCDDIGRDDCEDLPMITPSSIIIGEDGQTYSADQFDAGLRLDSPDNNMTLVTYQSRELNTSGRYLVVFVGELPAR